MGLLSLSVWLFDTCVNKNILAAYEQYKSW